MRMRVDAGSPAKCVKSMAILSQQHATEPERSREQRQSARKGGAWGEVGLVKVEIGEINVTIGRSLEAESLLKSLACGFLGNLNLAHENKAWPFGGWTISNFAYHCCPSLQVTRKSIR